MGFAGGSGSKPTTFSTQITCYKCGKPRHISSNYVDEDMTYFNCRQKRHIQRDCLYPKKKQNGGGLNDQTRRPKATGRVFTLNNSFCTMWLHIILGHLVSIRGIEVDKAKIDVITSLPYPTFVR